jgi:1,4-dihydroxy-2-naphthoate octaprenyltransferase
LQWTASTVICGVAVGLTIINILLANNYRDYYSDKKFGKNTTVVLFGKKFGSLFYLFNGLIAVGCCQYFWSIQSAEAALLPFIYLIFHIKTWKKMVSLDQGSKLIGILGETSRNTLIFGLTLVTGLILSAV